MPDSTIAALSNAAALGGTETFYAVQSAGNVKVTATQIKTFASAAPITVAGGTVTDPSTPLTVTQTWNDGADTFIGADMTITNTASAAASRLMRLQYGAAGSETSRFEVNPVGAITLSNGTLSATMRQLTWNTVTNIAFAAIGSSAAYDILAPGINCIDRWGAGDTDFLVTASYNRDGTSLARDKPLWWSDDAQNLFNQDTTIFRASAGVLGVRGANTTTGGGLNFLEQTAPAAPGANQAVIYAEDNGSGKTRLMVRFPTGAAQVLATEP
jgi:hypothetical protein